MNTTSRSLLGAAVLGCVLAAWTSPAAANPLVAGGWVATAALFQSGGGRGGPSDPKRDALALVAHARQAMDQENWEIAESLISRAESLNAPFGRLHLGDTPAKARRDFERRRPKDKAPAAAREAASARSQPQSGARGVPPASAAEHHPTAPAGSIPPAAAAARDEYAGRGQPLGGPTAEGSSVGRNEPAALVPSQDAQPLPPPAAAARRDIFDRPAAAATAPVADRRPASTAGNDPRSESDRLLLGARTALSVGDVAQATQLVARAKGLGVTYDLHADSPAKVEATLQKHLELNKGAGAPDTEALRRRRVELLMEQAEALLAWQAWDDAERLANDAKRLPVTFGLFDTKPDDLLGRIAAARRGTGRVRDDAVAPAAFTPPVAQPEGPQQQPAAAQAGARALYEPANDRTRNQPATGEFNAARRAEPPADLFRIPGQPDPGAAPAKPAARQAAARVASGEQIPPPASPASPPSSGQAPPAQSQPGSVGAPAALPTTEGAGSLLNRTAADQELLTRKVVTELASQQSEAKRLQASDPKGALEVLRKSRATVESAGLEQGKRDQLLRSVDRRIAEVEKYIEDNRARIELNERNTAVKQEIEREQRVKVEVQEKLALLVEDFNKLMDEQRFAEAEVLAKRAQELAPSEPIVQQLKNQSTFVRRFYNNQTVESNKERGFIDALHQVDVAATPFPDDKPYRFGDVKEWNALSKSPYRQKREGRLRRSEREIEIEQRLKTPVSLKFQEAPLSQVMDYLAKLAQVNLHLDPRGLAEQGVTSDTPVTIDLSQDISLKSALNLILEPLHLSYVIKNEVLNVTSEQLRDGDVFPVTYSVADLVIPIPNFTPNGAMGLAGALKDAQANLRPGMVGGSFAGEAPLGVVASANGSPTNAVIDPHVLAQMAGSSGVSGPVAGVSQGIGAGPGGLGGGAQADFDSLIELITSTIQPTSWDANGGPGAIQPFDTNLSLVISQTQEVHDEIAELLDQLRRLQDLQVTIEVRFITLNDNFFERIGVDFDFQLEDNVNPALVAGLGGTLAQGNRLQTTDQRLLRNEKQDVTVGLSAPGLFSADLDVPFRQDSFTAAVPQFGGFAAGTGATLGFAILSDIEAFFFIEAAQGDRRSNVLQAPKVTLFNGQQAFVSDTSQSPFVISVIPVVGDFAAAQQPVIVVLSEGTFLTVQAVISEDRRFVRLTIVPFFSSIGDVNTFTFTGSSSSVEETSSQGQKDDTTGRANRKTTSSEGTTVQLPTFSFVTVTTTVSVPDGGTVLLGGIKRLSEGRNEFGVPVLNKIPYLNRLFRNVGIGRETQSLMMMVTPRIIIQEEEEFNLTGQQPAP